MLYCDDRKRLHAHISWQARWGQSSLYPRPAQAVLSSSDPTNESFHRCTQPGSTITHCRGLTEFIPTDKDLQSWQPCGPDSCKRETFLPDMIGCAFFLPDSGFDASPTLALGVPENRGMTAAAEMKGIFAVPGFFISSHSLIWRCQVSYPAVTGLRRGLWIRGRTVTRLNGMEIPSSRVLMCMLMNDTLCVVLGNRELCPL